MYKYNKIIKIIIYSIFVFNLIFFDCYNVNAFVEEKDYTNVYFLSKINNQMDCILLKNYNKVNNETRYALIDTGTSTAINEMINYLKEKKVEELEFIVITHLHTDHSGGIFKILENFKVDSIYIKEFDKTFLTDGKYWQKHYDNILKICAEKSISIVGPSKFYGLSTTIKENERIYNDNYVTEFNNENTIFEFGSATVQIINWEIQYDENENRIINEGENENSLGILLTQGNKKAFFAGDINNLDGDEDRIASQIGKIDFMKLGHHGFGASSTENYMKMLSPQYIVITNTYNDMNQYILSDLKKWGFDFHFATQDETAVIARITDDDVSIKYEHANCEKYISGEWVYVEDIWAPELNVEYSNKNQTNTFVEVKIKSNEELQGVTGWTLSEDKLSLSKKYIENMTEIVMVRDLAGNESTVYVEVSNIKNSEEFKVNMLDNKYILAGIDCENNTVDRFLQMADFDGIYQVKLYKDKKEIKGNDKITTDTILRLYNEENNIYQDYEIIFYGDTNGDGQFSAIDALLVIKNKIGETQFNNNIYLEAGRVTEATREQQLIPNSADALAIVSAKLGKYSIKQ